jgi:kynurenine formamidase
MRFGVTQMSDDRSGGRVSGETKIWPQHEVGKELSNWGRWGADDQIGTLNFVTDNKRVRAAGLVRTGKVFDLGMAFDAFGPQGGGFRINPVHTVTYSPLDCVGAADGYFAVDDMITMGLQCATQWDSLAHVGYGGMFYNGVPQTAITTIRGASHNSIDKSVKNMISRGVLLDIARLKGVDVLPNGYEITSDDLSAAEERQGVRVDSGDFLCVRTGWYSYWLKGERAPWAGPPVRSVTDPAAHAGLGLDSMRWLHAREVASIVMDNLAFEVLPYCVPGAIIPVHQVAIRDMGLLVGEIFNFEELARDCADDDVYEFLFSGTALKITGAVGSPLTPMAIK